MDRNSPPVASSLGTPSEGSNCATSQSGRPEWTGSAIQEESLLKLSVSRACLFSNSVFLHLEGRERKTVSVFGILKGLLRRTTGFHIKALENSSFLISRRLDFWFSYDFLIQSIIGAKGVDLVLDIGANKGQFGKDIRNFYSGTIMSFEPVSSTFQRLQEVASSDPAWRVFQVALGSVEHSREINISSQDVFSLFLNSNRYCSERFGSESVHSETELVSVRRLDKLLEELVPDIRSKRIFLKMDTQGYDMEVYKGATGVLDNIVAIQSEVSLIPIYEGMPHWTDSISAYEQSGFSVVGMFPVNWDSKKVIEYDCVLQK